MRSRCVPHRSPGARAVSSTSPRGSMARSIAAKRAGLASGPTIRAMPQMGRPLGRVATVARPQLVASGGAQAEVPRLAFVDHVDQALRLVLEQDGGEGAVGVEAGEPAHL